MKDSGRTMQGIQKWHAVDPTVHQDDDAQSSCSLGDSRSNMHISVPNALKVIVMLLFTHDTFVIAGQVARHNIPKGTANKLMRLRMGRPVLHGTPLEEIKL